MRRQAVISRHRLPPSFPEPNREGRRACIRQARVCPGERAELLADSRPASSAFPARAVAAVGTSFPKRKVLSLRALFLLFALPLFLAGCATEEIPEKPPTPERWVRVMFSPNGLGDLSYSDDILRGVLEAKETTGAFQLHYHSPAGPEEAEALLKKWMEEDTDPARYYTILAANEYEEVAQRLLAGTGRANYLLLDPFSAQLQLPCLRFSGYGSSFLAGLAAYALTGADTVAYLGGRRGDYYIRECYDGFRDGYREAGGREVAETYVSDEAYGFAMPRRAYLMADSLFRLYPFVYAIAGGSNNGVYQYLREHPAVAGYTAGVDVDQSAYSDRIVGSAMKQIGLCVGDYIRRWLEGEELPLYTHCGLRSGYTSFHVAESYRPLLEKIVHDNFERAAARETEYENTRP